MTNLHDFALRVAEGQDPDEAAREVGGTGRPETGAVEALRKIQRVLGAVNCGALNDRGKALHLIQVAINQWDKAEKSRDYSRELLASMPKVTSDDDQGGVW